MLICNKSGSPLTVKVPEIKEACAESGGPYLQEHMGVREWHLELVSMAAIGERHKGNLDA